MLYRINVSRVRKNSFALTSSTSVIWGPAFGALVLTSSVIYHLPQISSDFLTLRYLVAIVSSSSANATLHKRERSSIFQAVPLG